MQKLKKSKTKKVNNVAKKLSQNSIMSDNLHVPLTSSVFLKIRPSVSRLSTSKYKKLAKIDEREKYTMQKCVSSPLRLSNIAPRAKVPENVAVHFASFYDEQRAGLPHSGDEKPATLENGSKNSTKMEFTRQMVHKLEHSAGTQHYCRQVSALLENTVESPGFDLRLPPADNCAPQFGKASDYFPLWYSDPSKMPLKLSRNKCYVLNESKNECQETVEAGRGGEDRKTWSSESLTDSLSSSSSSDTDTDTDAEVELDTETESKKIAGMRIRRRRNSREKHKERIIGGGRAKSHLSSTRSSRSSTSEITSRLSPDSNSAPRGKRFRDSRVGFFVDTNSPISDSFSRHSWSTRTSRTRDEKEEAAAEEEEEEEEEKKEEENEIEEEEEEEGEESVDWETTEDEEDASVEVKVVSNDLQKIGSIGGRNKISGKI